MKTAQRTTAALILLSAFALTTLSCSILPQHGPDTSRYYVLSLAPKPPPTAAANLSAIIGEHYVLSLAPKPPPTTPPAGAAAARTTPTPPLQRLTARVANIRLPAYLDRSEIVLRPTENRLDALSHDLWLEPPAKACSRVFAHNLAQHLHGSNPPNSTARDAVVVRVDIVQFDGYPGETVLLRARWKLSRTDDNETPLSEGEHTVQTSLQGKPGIENYVNGMSRAIDAFADAVAQDIRRALPDATW
ncbi:MAG: PqiC family protein [Puniceicoccales bacterium]|jgi:uncharacterized lipoprotein YmbA|nr:PqiC family protein [Puniceicoccales bacterium]